MSSHEGGDHQHTGDCHHEDKGKKTGIVLAPGVRADQAKHAEGHEGHDHSHEGDCHEHDTKTHIRKGLAANPDNHFNQKCAAEEAEHGHHEHCDQEHAKAHTHARQGHAANPDNHQH
ncbi:unnamed protein product, partial [Mesorhabditis belari]|uniref:Uncharacterized protein n=1 Tax=Mesorhabditis belari TaxID=2138241 RepID=A0AAF3J4A4_9BILA